VAGGAATNAGCVGPAWPMRVAYSAASAGPASRYCVNASCLTEQYTTPARTITDYEKRIRAIKSTPPFDGWVRTPDGLHPTSTPSPFAFRSAPADLRVRARDREGKAGARTNAIGISKYPRFRVAAERRRVRPNMLDQLRLCWSCVTNAEEDHVRCGSGRRARANRCWPRGADGPMGTGRSGLGKGWVRARPQGLVHRRPLA
jgi:hypothetical protein